MTTAPTTGSSQIQRMLPRHFKILEMRLAGCSNVEIARTLDCSENNIYAVSRSPLFLVEFNRQMREQIDNGIQLNREAFVGKARSILEFSSRQAAETQIDLLESDDDSVRLRASGSILDRALGKVESKTSGSAAPSVVINAPDAQLLIIALKESTDAQERHTTANGSSTSSSQGPTRDVCKASSVRPWFGHREAKASYCSKEIVVVDGVG